MKVEWLQIPLDALQHLKISEYGEVRYIETDEEYALASKRQYMYNVEHGLNTYMKRVVTKDMSTGIIMYYNSLKELSKDINVGYEKLKSVINNNKKVSRVEHYIGNLRFGYEEAGVDWV